MASKTKAKAVETKTKAVETPKAETKSTPKAEVKAETKAVKTPRAERAEAETNVEAVQSGDIGPNVDALHAFLEANTKFKASDEEVASHYGPATRAAVQDLQARMAQNGSWTGKVDGEVNPAFIAAVQNT